MMVRDGQYRIVGNISLSVCLSIYICIYVEMDWIRYTRLH